MNIKPGLCSVSDVTVRSMAESGNTPAVHAHIFVSGRVQRVGYRAFVVRAASAHCLFGGVRNLDDGRVEVEVEGAKAAIESLLEDLRRGPSASHVLRVEVEWSACTERFSSFSIWY